MTLKVLWKYILSSYLTANSEYIYIFRVLNQNVFDIISVKWNRSAANDEVELFQDSSSDGNLSLKPENLERSKDEVVLNS